MIRTYAVCVFILSLLLGCQDKAPMDTSVFSPDHRIKVEVSIDPPDSSLSYQVAFRNKAEYTTVVEPSLLGLIRNDRGFAHGFASLKVSETRSGSESYEMLIGKKRKQDAAYQEKHTLLPKRMVPH